MSRRTKTAKEFLPRSAGAGKAAGRPIRVFRPADACLHHQAASLMKRHDRQAWAKSANAALRRGKTVEEAVAEGNFTLNAFLDYDADAYSGTSPLYIALTREEAILQNNRRIIADDPALPATSRRFRDSDYYSTELDFDRHPQLLATVERQRRAAGRSH